MTCILSETGINSDKTGEYKTFPRKCKDYNYYDSFQYSIQHVVSP